MNIQCGQVQLWEVVFGTDAMFEDEDGCLCVGVRIRLSAWW